MYAATRLINRRSVLSAIVLLFVMSVAYAFAGNNIVPDTGAGDGRGLISGYTVSNIDYLLEDGDTDPTDIDTVTFTLADNAAEPGVATQPEIVKISLAPAGPYFTCTTPTSMNITCPNVNVLVTAATELRVIAAD